jgi:hypothetical protein
MIPPKEFYPAIVQWRSGCGTGDTLVIDSHGTWWKIVDHLPARGTGDRQAQIVNGAHGVARVRAART